MPSKDLTSSSSRNYEHRAQFNFSFFVFVVLLLLLCMCHPVLEALYVVTAMVQQQPHFKAFPFWEPRTVFLCVCVSACLCAILNGIWTIATYTSSDFQKHPCRTQASQSQRCNKQRTSHTLIYMSCLRRIICFPPQLATRTGFQVNRIPKELEPTSPTQTLEMPFSFFFFSPLCCCCFLSTTAAVKG